MLNNLKHIIDVKVASSRIKFRAVIERTGFEVKSNDLKPFLKLAEVKSLDNELDFKSHHFHIPYQNNLLNVNELKAGDVIEFEARAIINPPSRYKHRQSRYHLDWISKVTPLNFNINDRAQMPKDDSKALIGKIMLNNVEMYQHNQDELLTGDLTVKEFFDHQYVDAFHLWQREQAQFYYS